MGAVDWHNYGRVRNVWEFGWDCFVNTLLTMCTILRTIGALYNCVVMGPHPGYVAKLICVILCVCM